MILGYGPSLHLVLEVIEQSLDNSLAEFRALRKAASAARGAGKAGQARLERAARKAAERLRALDLDRVHRQTALSALRRLARTSRDRGLARQIARVEAAERAAMRTRQEFVHANLRLVVTVARHYRHGGLPLADLIQEGNLGLLKAVDRYDHRRGFRFSTYATWWIRHAVGRAIADKGQGVRIPVHLLETKQRIGKTRRQLAADLGRLPTRGEIAEALDLSESKVDQVEGQLPETAISLDGYPMDDDERPLLEVFRDPAADERSPLDSIAAEDETAEIKREMRNLSPIETDVLHKRFGLGPHHERTLREIAEEYGLSRERIRQIEAQALRKLRRSMRK
jgi:RNA polymerase primary sigma factor